MTTDEMKELAGIFTAEGYKIMTFSEGFEDSSSSSNYIDLRIKPLSRTKKNNEMVELINTLDTLHKEKKSSWRLTSFNKGSSARFLFKRHIDITIRLL